MSDFKVPYELGGMGLSSLIAPINIMANQGMGVLLVYVLVGMILPIFITLAIHRVLKMAGKVKPGELHLEVQ